MNADFLKTIETTLAEIEADGLFKREREIVSPQSGRIRYMRDGTVKEAEVLVDIGHDEHGRVWTEVDK